MANNNFSLNSLSANPNFNFLNTILDQDDNDCDFEFNDSPYQTTDILCEYIDPVSYASTFKNLSDVSILSLNVQSLSAKFPELKELISSLLTFNCAPDVICLQEIWQITVHADFSLPGYSTLEYKTRSNIVQGGGVGIYVRCNIPYSVAPMYSVFSDRLFESIFVKLNLPSTKLLVGSVYRPNINHPNLTQTEQLTQSLDLLSNLYSQLSSNNANVRILGDFNIDVLKYNTSNVASEYVDLFFSFGFLEVITKPTRCTPTSATLIDHVLSNAVCDNIRSYILTSLISDHFPIIYICNTKKIKQKVETIPFRDFSQANIDRFRETLHGINWSEVTDCEDPQSAYNRFSDIFKNFFELYFPLEHRKPNRNFTKLEPWFTKGLIISHKNKLLLGKTAARVGNPDSRAKYKHFRNIYNRVVRLAKKLYFERELIANQSNLKKTWELIRNAANLPKTNKEGISQMLIDGALVGDPLTIATKFDEHFVTMPAAIVSGITPPAHPYDLDHDPAPVAHPLFSFNNSPVTRSEVMEAFKELKPKKFQDTKHVSMFFLSKIFDKIAKPIHHVIQTSLMTGIVPSQLKIAKIVPIYKSGDRTVMDNYRPISLLDNFSKILKKVVFRRLSNFVEANNIITPSQFGFRKNHSTIHPLVHFVHNVSTALNKKHHAIAIFCDLRKAFDMYSGPCNTYV